MGTHALLSPSSAHRWMHCTPSARLEEGVEDSSSDYAREGSLAHALGALKLKEFLGADTGAEREEIAGFPSSWITGEMEECTDGYAGVVGSKFVAATGKTPDAQLLIETRLDFGEFIPESFGTADAVIIAAGLMEVVDFKYGKGVKVEASDNVQMAIYALGAWERFSVEYRIERIRMTIYQPRIDNVSEWETDVASLLRWRDEKLVPKAREAFKGYGVAVPGEWCRFCKVKGRCRAVATASLKAVEGDVRLMGAVEIATKVLPKLALVKSWITSVEEYTLQEALNGTEYPGYKLVEGRSVRKVSDTEGMAEALRGEGYTDEEIFRQRELKPLSDLERLVGKKRFSDLTSGYIDKPQGKPTLVEESDKRPALNNAESEFADIDPEELKA